MSVSELACTYACLALHDDAISINAEKIATLVKAANVTVESYWPSLFAKLLEKKNIEDLIMNAASGGGGGGGCAPVAASASAGGAAPAAASAPAAAEKKEEQKEESDNDDLGFSLFD